MVVEAAFPSVQWIDGKNGRYYFGPWGLIYLQTFGPASCRPAARKILFEERELLALTQPRPPCRAVLSAAEEGFAIRRANLAERGSRNVLPWLAPPHSQVNTARTDDATPRKQTSQAASKRHARHTGQ